jgi:hypothetical protein
LGHIFPNELFAILYRSVSLSQKTGSRTIVADTNLLCTYLHCCIFLPIPLLCVMSVARLIEKWFKQVFSILIGSRLEWVEVYLYSSIRLRARSVVFNSYSDTPPF